MSNDSPTFIGRLLSSVELKLIFSWLLVVAVTMALDTNHTYWDSPGDSAEVVLRQTVLLGFFALGKRHHHHLRWHRSFERIGHRHERDGLRFAHDRLGP